MAFTHTNTRGQQYVLHGKQVRLMNGRHQHIYYFARTEGAGAVDAVPAGYAVTENARTGLPFLKRES